MSPASDQSGKESPGSDVPNQSTVRRSETRKFDSLAHPEIIISDAFSIGKSFGSTEKTPDPAKVDKVSEKTENAFSSRQSSPKPFDTSRSPQSLAEGSLMTSTIACYLRVIFENFKSAEDLSVSLHKQEGYQVIKQEAEKHAKTISAESIGPKKLKFFYGNCTIVSDNGAKVRLPLRSPEDWTEVRKRIVGYRNEHTDERLHLCISQNYLASQEQPTDGKALAEVKHLEIDDLMKQAWDNKDYIPRNVLEKVISDEVIELIIKEDPPKSIAQDQQYAFIHRVQAEGRILLAMCVHWSLRMECLKKLLDSGLEDSTLLLDDKSQCHGDCRGKLRKLRTEQGAYRAERFAEGDHKKLQSHAVVPLHFCPRDHGKDDLDREVAEAHGQELQNPTSRDAIIKSAWCGSGAYSNVYCVKLNPDHHRLSVDLDSCFALKEFKDKPKLVENFERELAMLKELRRHSHPHIVTHLATWTQGEKYCMLFPYALCNLREYMGDCTFTQEDAVWLLSQFHGMADAVKHAHDLSDLPDKEAATSNLTVNPPTPGVRRTAWHHDIKPENILFFRDSSSTRGMFRISDWGSAKINTYLTRSYRTDTPKGTPTYDPPEQTYEGKTSRPRDIWSLGCVFLEFVIWAVHGSRFVKKFSSERIGKSITNSGTDSTTDDAFWQESGKEYKLRESVVTQLEGLDKELGKPGALPFKEVVGHIRRMLETQANKRIKAKDLCALFEETILAKKMEVESPSNVSKPVTQLSSIPKDQKSPDTMAHGTSPIGRSSGPTYAERYDLSPSEMSPRANQLSSHATHSRQSSNASNRSTLSIRDRRGSHSSVNASRANEGGT